ncbi:protein translocase subunit SecF [Candidatus Pantoea edessiphila]|uniref:Protein-export membrane protein SecF n=1 Tax=Candidatus Pantoea edessiphila TaxID=2044610 RepID=A0A2P5SXG8_9GAMM|nr:protein translocase subunit SecF [Candidatus Pantoea edessiphila]MBK4775860.1 protein translocase subunit SecF [Pantoea sp. Edef]PPI87029.1 protein translocase subunit SecF [Candidatus Pantoea edessiphila]
MIQISDISKSYEGYKTIDFMRWNKLAFLILLFLVISFIFIIYIFNFNWSIDFTGGTVIEANFEKSIDTDQLRDQLIKIGFNSPIVHNLGDSKSIIIKIRPQLDLERSKQFSSNQIISVIKSITKQKTTINRIDSVGPSIGSDLTFNGFIALLFAIVAIFLYIGIRFEWYIAFGTVVALLSDLVITCGILSLLCIEIDLTIIASLMSVIGYSLNDKIVISDRIRENSRKMQTTSYYDIINISLNQVLKRTLMTSFITLIIVLILLIFGGYLLKGFSLTMVIGIIVGTISSIYISLSLALITSIIKNKTSYSFYQ